MILYRNVFFFKSETNTIKNNKGDFLVKEIDYFSKQTGTIS